jgi:Mg2+-importing ATPase
MDNPSELSLQEIATLDLSVLFSKLDSGAQGLTSQQAARQLQRFGPNTLQLPSGPSSGRRLLQLIGAPLSLLLMALATVSFLTGEVRGAVVIATMVILSTLLTFAQERKSNRAAEKLRNLVKTFALVERDGQAQKIALDAVVPGDVLHLAVGDLIAADVRIIEAKDLFINEASLSGESLPTEKHPNPAGHGTPIGLTDQNLCFMGSHVVSGIGSAIVVRTGAATFFAEVARQTTAQTRKSAFDQGLERFTGLMIRFMAVMVPIVFIVNGLAKGDWFEAALFALAVAVGLTPEMLPMLTTVNLAKGALALSRQKVIVKRLNAVQNMGAMDILCTDKTGTLTQDTVIVERRSSAYVSDDVTMPPPLAITIPCRSASTVFSVSRSRRR